MKHNKLLFLLIVLTLLTSCASSKINKTLKQGNIVQEDFKTTIPFEYRKGLIILKVTIENETYDFILDTGASNVLSKELAEKLNVKSLGSENVTDIHKTSQLLNYTKIDDIEIGGINFQNTIAAISDFNSGELACLNADGFIGSNLMRFAVWDFDFENQIITITDDEQKLNIPADAIESKMFIGTAASQPSIISYINGDKALNNMIDLGNNSTPHLSYLDFLKQKKSNKITKYISGSGYSGIGMYGKGEKKNELAAKVDEIKIGDHIIKNKVMRIKDGKTNLGILFFKNYRLILNWEERNVKMVLQEGTSNNTELNHFGFNPNFNENKVFVDFIYNDTEVAKLLQFGDQILQINNIDYSNITNENKCDFFNNGLIPKETDEIMIKVLRNGERLEFQLKKVRLL
ncbi:aspartyl protease family protein [Allomuricauda sp. F6463D]|uniref:aspartyl protease family protein n=1 Tax=Allomuricauda sp. F6463D TaxID=2926409 RepID=UPI001FF43374|nr:aspartyl protease family protein [Muricauda sp. F6463D]MCK0159448.1 aspartyl protease family protein [Muricauda sp. F6463D]